MNQPPPPPKHISPYRNAPKIFGLKFKVASRVLLVFEAILGKLILVLAICSIIYSPSWYPVIINFLFFSMFVFSVICYNLCLNNKSSIHIFPMLTYEIATIFWIFIWLYAALNDIASGSMFSLEWFGGPSASRTPTSHDIKDINYVNPNETHPEVKKTLKYGLIICGVCVILITLKLFAFVIARRTFFQVRKMEIENVVEQETAGCETSSEISNVGGTSPSFPIAYRNRPPGQRMATVQEVHIEEYTPQPSPIPAPRRKYKKLEPTIPDYSAPCQYSPLPRFEESSF